MNPLAKSVLFTIVCANKTEVSPGRKNFNPDIFTWGSKVNPQFVLLFEEIPLIARQVNQIFPKWVWHIVIADFPTPEIRNYIKHIGPNPITQASQKLRGAVRFCLNSGLIFHHLAPLADQIHVSRSSELTVHSLPLHQAIIETHSMLTKSQISLKPEISRNISKLESFWRKRLTRLNQKLSKRAFKKLIFLDQIAYRATMGLWMENVMKNERGKSLIVLSQQSARPGDIFHWALTSRSFPTIHPILNVEGTETARVPNNSKLSLRHLSKLAVCCKERFKPLV